MLSRVWDLRTVRPGRVGRPDCAQDPRTAPISRGDANKHARRTFETEIPPRRADRVSLPTSVTDPRQSDADQSGGDSGHSGVLASALPRSEVTAAARNGDTPLGAYRATDPAHWDTSGRCTGMHVLGHPSRRYVAVGGSDHRAARGKRRAWRSHLQRLRAAARRQGLAGHGASQNDGTAVFRNASGPRSSAAMPGTGPRDPPLGKELNRGLLYGAAHTVRSRMPRVAFNADSGMIGQPPRAFHFSLMFDQS